MRTTYARYIVTATRPWSEPLRRTSFEVRLPPGALDPQFSYPFRRKGPSERVWSCEARDFLPSEDIVVRCRYQSAQSDRVSAGGRPAKTRSALRTLRLRDNRYPRPPPWGRRDPSFT